MTDLQKYRKFFQGQGFQTRTFQDGDDVKVWLSLEVKWEGIIKTVFFFDYGTEKHINLDGLSNLKNK